MAQYYAELISREDLPYFALDYYLAIPKGGRTLKINPSEVFKGCFLSFSEEVPAGDGDGAGGGSYVWAG